MSDMHMMLAADNYRWLECLKDAFEHIKNTSSSDLCLKIPSLLLKICNLELEQLRQKDAIEHAKTAIDQSEKCQEVLMKKEKTEEIENQIKEQNSIQAMANIIIGKCHKYYKMPNSDEYFDRARKIVQKEKLTDEDF